MKVDMSMRSMTGKKGLYPLVALAVLVVAGCSASSPGASPAPQAAARHGSGGKPGAPVSVRFNVPSKLSAGVPITVTVQIISAVDADELQLQWIPSAGLVLGATPNPTVITAPVKGRSYVQQVTVMASADGEYFLGVMASLRAGVAAQTRVLSARLNVGTVTVKAKPALTTDSQQTPIESMPAQESVPK
jgi:hypothetical protein